MAVAVGGYDLWEIKRASPLGDARAPGSGHLGDSLKGLALIEPPAYPCLTTVRAPERIAHVHVQSRDRSSLR